jgi:hypothetical protein
MLCSAQGYPKPLEFPRRQSPRLASWRPPSVPRFSRRSGPPLERLPFFAVRGLVILPLPASSPPLCRYHKHLRDSAFCCAAPPNRGAFHAPSFGLDVRAPTPRASFETSPGPRVPCQPQPDPRSFPAMTYCIDVVSINLRFFGPPYQLQPTG